MNRRWIPTPTGGIILAMTEVRRDVMIDRVAMTAARARDALRYRDEAIVEAVQGGMSQREVARIAGLSHTAVQNIIRR